jgi:hypothetical protein
VNWKRITWDAHTSEEHKYDLWDGMPFSPANTYERDRLAVCLVYNMGLEHFGRIQEGFIGDFKEIKIE